MNASKNTRVSQAMADGAGDDPVPAKPPDPPTQTKRTTSAGVLCGRLYDRIKLLNSEEDAELKNAPSSIRERFAKKRADLLEKASPEVAATVAKWLKAEEPEGEAAQ